MDCLEICAVLRYRHEEYRFINLWDVQSIIVYLVTPDVIYDNLKEEVKSMVVTLGGSKVNSWRESLDDLKIAEERGYKDPEMFEKEDPRRMLETTPSIFKLQSEHKGRGKRNPLFV